MIAAKLKRNQAYAREIASTNLAILYARESDPYGDRKEKKRATLGVSAETSIKQQITEMKALARELGAIVRDEDIFTERFTGVDSLWDRPVITQVRELIHTRKYKYLIVYDTDRLARDPYHTGFVLQECMKAGCELRFVKTPIENSEIGQFMLFIKGWGDKNERMKFMDRVRRGRSAIVKSGRIPTSGKALYGYVYDTERKVRVIDPVAAAIVQKIFRWVGLEGLSANEVRRRLNSQGVPSPADYMKWDFRDERNGTCRWNVNTVLSILHEPSYTGRTYTNRYRVTEQKNKRGRYISEPLPFSEWKLITESQEVTPVIISEELFKQAQQALERNRTTHGHTTRNNRLPMLLRGMVYCLECDNRMYPNKEHDFYTYKCSAFKLKNGPKCGGGRVRAKELEDIVWRKVVEIFRDPTVIQVEVARILEEMPSDQLEDDLVAAKEQIVKKRKLRDAFLTRWENALSDADYELAETFDVKVKVASDDIKALQGIIDDLQTRVAAKSRVEEVAAQFAEYCQKAAAGFDKIDIPFERKVQALTELRVKVLAHSKRRPKLQLNTGTLVGLGDEEDAGLLTEAVSDRGLPRAGRT